MAGEGSRSLGERLEGSCGPDLPGNGLQSRRQAAGGLLLACWLIPAPWSPGEGWRLAPPLERTYGSSFQPLTKEEGKEPSPSSVERASEPEPSYRRLEVLPVLRAWLRAMATACLCGRPAFISVLMLWLTVFLEEPFFSGMDLFFPMLTNIAHSWHITPATVGNRSPLPCNGLRRILLM